MMQGRDFRGMVFVAVAALTLGWIGSVQAANYRGATLTPTSIQLGDTEPPTTQPASPIAEDEKAVEKHVTAPPPERGPRQPGRGPGRSGEPPGRHGRQSTGFGRMGGFDGMGRPPRPDIMERILPLLADEHPELVERLKQMREQSPAGYERLVADALAIRFEHAMKHGGPGPKLRGPFLPPDELDGVEEMKPPGDRPPFPGFDYELEETWQALLQRDDELDAQTTVLVEQYKQLAEDGSVGHREALAKVRENLEQTVQKHFELRGEIRKIELQRIEQELKHLQEVVDHIRQNLTRREKARDSITSRRIEQLLGADPK